MVLNWFSSLTDAVAMDCEMVGVGSEGNKSALGRVTLVLVPPVLCFFVFLIGCIACVCNLVSWPEDLMYAWKGSVLTHREG